MSFDEPRIWSLQSLEFRGHKALQENGTNGVVLSTEAPFDWVGGLHRQGGIERLESWEATIDGTNIELVDGDIHFFESNATFRRNTQLHDMLLTSTYSLTNDSYSESFELSFPTDQRAEILYVLMSQWDPNFVHFAGLTNEGRVVTGQFQGDEDWEGSGIYSAYAVYNSANDGYYATLDASSPANLMQRFRDSGRYRKFYHNAAYREVIPQGTEMSFRQTITPFWSDQQAPFIIPEPNGCGPLLLALMAASLRLRKTVGVQIGKINVIN